MEKPGEKRLFSRLAKTFCMDLLIELEMLCMDGSDANSKSLIVDSILKKYGVKFSPIGSGTNRYAIMVDGYCMKVALDEDGKTDNKREFMYSKALQPYVIKCYEIFPTGIIGSFEYVTVFDSKDQIINKARMREILTDISKSFLIGDMGVGSKNYLNWGYRITGDREIVILDYAYIYNLSYRVFVCNKCGGMLKYSDEDFNYLKCSSCGSNYSFWDIRNKVPKKLEQKEIGEIRDKGYNLTDCEQIVQIDPRFDDLKKSSKKKVPDEFEDRTKIFTFDFKDESDQPNSTEESMKVLMKYLESEDEKDGKEEERKIRI